MIVRPRRQALRHATALTVVSLATALAVGSCSSDDEQDDTTGSPAVQANASDEIAADGSVPGDVILSGPFGSRPAFDLPAGFAVDTSVTAVVDRGDGPVVTLTDSVLLEFVLVNGRNGNELRATYEQGPEVLEPDSTADLPYLQDAIAGQRVGDRLFVAIAPEDGYGDRLSTAADSQARPDDTLVYVIDILAVVLAGPEGAPADAVPPDVPQPVEDASGAVTGVTVPPGEPPAEVTAHALVAGDGPGVQGTDTRVTVDYVGVLRESGTVFDTTVTQGFPATFRLDEVLPCWGEALVGQTVGSRVVLECPAASAYGDDERPGIPPGSDLVFVVDLLAVS